MKILFFSSQNYHNFFQVFYLCFLSNNSSMHPRTHHEFVPTAQKISRFLFFIYVQGFFLFREASSEEILYLTFKCPVVLSIFKIKINFFFTNLLYVFTQYQYTCSVKLFLKHRLCYGKLFYYYLISIILDDFNKAVNRYFYFDILIVCYISEILSDFKKCLNSFIRSDFERHYI